MSFEARVTGRWIVNPMQLAEGEGPMQLYVVAARSPALPTYLRKHSKQLARRSERTGVSLG